MRQGQSLRQSPRAPPAAASSWFQARLWVMRGPLALELGSDVPRVSVTKVSEDHTGMCSSLYSSCPSSSKFGSASSESSCTRSRRSAEAGMPTQPHGSPAPPLASSPHGSQTFPALSEGTVTPDRSTSLQPKPHTPHHLQWQLLITRLMTPHVKDFLGATPSSCGIPL